jgi:hypothetical protein
MKLGFFQKLLAKFLGPKIVRKYAASTIGMLGTYIAVKLPGLAPEAISEFVSGLTQIIIFLANMALTYFIDDTAMKIEKGQIPVKPEIVKED